MRPGSAGARIMSVLHEWTYNVSAHDFSQAGNASADIKRRLKEIGIDAETARRASIAVYEGEINMVIHADGGKATVRVTDQTITMILEDHGRGIKDVEKAIQAGYSTANEQIRSLGFGAGMGLPNMKKYTDDLQIETTPGQGTTVTMRIDL